MRLLDPHLRSRQNPPHVGFVVLGAEREKDSGATQLQEKCLKTAIGMSRTVLGEVHPFGSFLTGNANGYVTQYPTFSSYGINGGYYYGKIAYTF